MSCTCEYPDIESCEACGYVHCGMEDTSKLQHDIHPAIVGCGKQIYRCSICNEVRN